MSVQYEEANFDFDFDFLNPASNKSVILDKPDKSEKSRKAILIVKKKIVATDSLIRRYYEKRDEVEQFERALQISKDECKQTCLDFKSISEKYEMVQKEVELLRHINSELQNKCNHTENLLGAIQSHAKQLQILVKEKETTIESLTIENQLQNTNVKDSEKNVSAIKKANADLIKDICLMRDVISGKRKLNKHSKFIIKKYEKCCASEDEGSILDHDSDTDFETHSALSPQILNLSVDNTVKNNIKAPCITSKDENEHDSDCSNELASRDTGRGSSLAFSDGEKCFNSPEYFLNHSPVNTQHDKEKNHYVDSATSSIQSSQEVSNHKSVSNFESFQMVLSPINTESKVEPGSPVESEIISSAADDEIAASEDEIVTFDSGNALIEDEHAAADDDQITVDKHASVSENRVTVENVMIFDEHTLADNETVVSDFGLITADDDQVTTDNSVGHIAGDNVHASIPTVTESFDNHIMHEPKPFKKTGGINIIENIPVKITQIRNDYKNPPENLSHNIVSKCSKTFDRNDRTKDMLCEKECLELNSNHFKQEEASTGDTEIEMILNKMRFNRKLITPIPSTPSKSRTASSGRDRSSKTSHRGEHVCKDAAQLKEENKVLLDKFTKLEQEITFIKDIINNKFKLGNTQQNLQSVVGIQLNPSNHLQTSKVNITDSRNKDTETATSAATEIKATRQCTKSPVPRIISYSPISEIPEHDLGHMNNENCNSDDNVETEMRDENITQRNIIDEHVHDSVAHNKHRKLSKLDKLRKNLVPKSKIKRISTPTINKKRVVPKEIPLKKITTESETAAILNNKNAYEKAVQIMSELKSQQKCVKPKATGNKLEVNARTVTHDSPKATETKSSNEAYVPTSPINIPQHLQSILSFKNDCGPSKYKSHTAETVLGENIHTALQQIPKIIDNKSINSECNVTRQKATQGNKSEENMCNNTDRKSLNSFCDVTKLKDHALEFESNRHLVVHANPTNVETLSSNCSPTKHKTTTDTTSPCKKELKVAVEKCDENRNCQITPKKQIATRSRSKNSITSRESDSESDNILLSSLVAENNLTPKKIILHETQNSTRKRHKHDSTDNQDIPCKRVLRSSNLRKSTSEESSIAVSQTSAKKTSPEEIKPNNDENLSVDAPPCNKNVLNYSDLDIFDDKCNSSMPPTYKSTKRTNVNPNEIPFCAMLDKYGKQSRKNHPNKVSDSVLTAIHKSLQDEIAIITELNANEAKHAMNKLVDTIQGWDFKEFMTAFMSYLKDPQRKMELYNKINSPPAPPMTKSEQILLYVISQLRMCTSSFDVLNCILCNIEYVLFKLNRTPEFDTIESMAHFYAVLCRYFKMKSRLRLFMLDAMYCIQFKAVPLIKQCLDVWMHVLPLAHMGIAKSPLVTCLVYLLHFYKCEDRFNRVQEIRNILSRKYFYEITEWNEPKIIEMFRNAIKDVKAIPVEIKLLRIALIVISKRHGPKWCQKNIVKNLLLPMLQNNVNERVKIFCISMLGPLLKPYPVDMKVHCEIVVNLLLDTLIQQTSTPQMEEAIITSLIYMSKHNQTRILQTLLTWKPKQISPRMEMVLRDFVIEKPIKVWKAILSKIELNVAQ